MSGTREILVPDIGDYKDVPIIEVFIKPGDILAKEATVVTMESEKATLDVPSEVAGTVAEVRVKPGDRVSRGSLLAIVELATNGSAAPASAPVLASVPAPVSTPAAPPASAPAPVPAGEEGALSHRILHAGPSVRRFARELGVNLGAVRGSGPNGRITRDDVQGWVKGALSGGSGVTGGEGLHLLPWPKVDFASFGPVERAPLSRIKRLSGPYLHRNWVMIPHVTQNDEADITELEAWRKQINNEQSEAKVTMLAFLVAASVAVLKRFPDFNSSLEGDELVLKRYYHIGFAADTPNGLMVPVLRDADRKGIVAIARETAELAKKARDGKLSSAEMQGGTFTISSLGGIGGLSFTPIINAPEVAILGVTKAAMKPVWDGQAFVPRMMLPLSLSYDHRVVDGAAAARFCVALAQTLTDLRRVLL
jgi:pyruvate dehydrogenase E2 component (dihydrolipoamide acetyltransferase)